MADEYGRQAYIPQYDPADRIAEAKAAIARERAAAEAEQRETDDTEPGDAA